MIATRILKPESLKLGKPHCFITIYGDGAGSSYYYIVPISIEDGRVLFSRQTGGDNLSVDFMFNNEEINVYRISGSFPRRWYVNFEDLKPAASRAFHLKGG